MTSKVVGLRDDLDQLIETEAAKILTADQFLELPGFDKIMDAIVAVSHAEGVVEGAEVGVSAARRQLRAASASVTKQEGTRSINGVRHYLIPVKAFSVPIASVLAPTKAQP